MFLYYAWTFIPVPHFEFVYAIFAQTRGFDSTAVSHRHFDIR